MPRQPTNTCYMKIKLCKLFKCSYLIESLMDSLSVNTVFLAKLDHSNTDLTSLCVPPHCKFLLQC